MRKTKRLLRREKRCGAEMRERRSTVDLMSLGECFQLAMCPIFRLGT